jgi:septation ring formation regulator EzrA
MASSEDFDSRLTAVESGVAAARTLASSAHADVAEVKTALNAHFRVLNALRETQVDHGLRLDRLEARFDGLEARFDDLEAKVDRGFAAVQQRFAEVDQNFAQVNQNFARVERQFSIVNVGIAQITAMLTNLTDPGSPAGQN